MKHKDKDFDTNILQTNAHLVDSVYWTLGV